MDISKSIETPTKSRGYILLLISVAALVTSNLIAKELYNHFSVPQTQFVVRIFSIFAAFANGIPDGIYDFQEYKKSVPPVICITVASLFWSYGIDFSNPGDCITIVSMLPLYTAFIGWLFFKKAFPRRGFLQSMLGCISGCVLLVQPSFIFGESPTTTTELIGYVLILFDLCFYSSYILFTEIIDINPVFLVIMTSTVRMTVFGVMTLIEFQWSHINIYSWLLIIIAAIMLTIGGVTRTAATRITGSVPAAFFILLETPLTYIFQYVFLALSVNLLQLVGVATTLTGVVYFIHISNAKEKEEIDPFTSMKEEEL